MKMQTGVTAHWVSIIFMMVLWVSVTACADRSPFESISQEAFIEKVGNSDVVIIDVRTPEEYASGYIPNAINIPHDKILDDTSIIDVYKNQDIVFYCHSGVRAGKVLKALSADSTSKTYHLQGDYRAWHGSNRNITVPQK